MPMKEPWPSQNGRRARLNASAAKLSESKRHMTAFQSQPLKPRCPTGLFSVELNLMQDVGAFGHETELEPKDQPKAKPEPPAMGERRARWGLGYQDKVCAERILNTLRDDLRSGVAVFEGVRLADIYAGKTDDFVLVWGKNVEGNSIKWSQAASPYNWAELVGEGGLLKELADGLEELRGKWLDRNPTVCLQSNCPPSQDRHPNQLIAAFSVAEFLKTHWANGPREDDPQPLKSAWGLIQQHCQLDDDGFRSFVGNCKIILGHPQPPGNGADDRDWQHYLKQFDALHKAIGTWLTNNPDSEFFDRGSLEDAIEFRGYRTSLIQRFPQPAIPYGQNSLAAEALKKLIEDTSGGYLAVVGPAGIGKSTLVQDVLGGQDHPFFIPYYAFLPDHTGTSRDRAESLTFFQDVVGRLEKKLTRRHSLGIADIAEGREALRQQFAKANEQYLIQGYKTIILIDGLDHAAREVGITSPVLNELPNPVDVPDGVIVILGSQPQALEADTIPPLVAHAISPASGRRVVLEGLSREDVFTIVSKIPKATSAAERDSIYRSCKGNPLILTYILKLFLQIETNTVDESISQLGSYEGDIHAYYFNCLSPSLQLAATREVLGLISRAAPTIPIEWLSTWPEKTTIEDLCTRPLAPFVNVDHGNLSFIHNSLIAFLKDETRSKIPGANPIAGEQAFHSTLADRCGSESSASALGRSKLLHLQKAGRDEELLSLLSPDWLRSSIAGFVPYSLLHPLLLAGIDTAWRLHRYGDVVRLTLLIQELDQRSSRTQSIDLAKQLLALDMPDAAILQVRSAGRFLVEEKEALDFTRRIWFYGRRTNSEHLQNVARSLYLESKPLVLIYHGEPIDTSASHDYYRILRSWADAAPLFEPIQDILTQIANLDFEVHEGHDEVDASNTKCSLLYGALQTALSGELPEGDVDQLIKAIGGQGEPAWYFAALISAAQDGHPRISQEQLKEAFAPCAGQEDFALDYALYLWECDRAAEAKSIVAGLQHVRFDSIRDHRSLGFTDLSFSTYLRFLQEMLGLPEGEVPGVKDDNQEALARVEWASRELGRLRASIVLERQIPDLHLALRAVLLFENRQIVLPQYDFRKGYAVRQGKSQIFRELLAVASEIGQDGLSSLWEELVDITRTTGSSIIGPSHSRKFAEGLLLEGKINQAQALEFALRDTSDAEDEDPTERQKACFEIATFSRNVGKPELCQTWLNRASTVTAGSGSHKDYHIAYIADWLDISIESPAKDNQRAAIEKLARVIQVAGGAGQDDAARTLIGTVMRVDPASASRLAIEFIDRGVLYLADTIGGLLAAGAQTSASIECLEAIYCELASLVDPASTEKAGEAVLRKADQKSRAAVALSLMNSVRTNALPSHRIEVGRALRDALLEDGNGPLPSLDGLKAGRDDSAKSSKLYRLGADEALTVDEIAQRLADAKDPASCDTNPNENTDFDWWAAIKKVNVKSRDQLNALVAAFPGKDYRKTESLIWQASQLFALGQKDDAWKLTEGIFASVKDDSWFRWYDGAQKREAYALLKMFKPDSAISAAREQFGKDMAAGRLGGHFMMSELQEVLEFLEIPWPSEAAISCISDYLDEVLEANTEIAPFAALQGNVDEAGVDESLCRFIVHLLAFPVVDIGVAARRALARYVCQGGDARNVWKAGQAMADPVQIEHVLIALHIGALHNRTYVDGLRDAITALNSHESVAVRSVARRICDIANWTWKEVNDRAPTARVLLADPVTGDVTFDEAHSIIGGGPIVAEKLYSVVFGGLQGGASQESRSDFKRLYDKVGSDYAWSKDSRLKQWMRLSLANFWLSQRAILGREAAMRLLGQWALEGRTKGGAEAAYDFLYPIYDPALELLHPIERPDEMRAMDWDFHNDESKRWLSGEGGNDWASYPTVVAGMHVLAERTMLIRPDWERPREERIRGVLTKPLVGSASKDVLRSRRELVSSVYYHGDGQDDNQLTIWNGEDELVGPQYRWTAFNASVAHGLGWVPSDKGPIAWEDSRGELMVTNAYWKDGWVWLVPPRFESLGEGWLTLASDAGLAAIRQSFPESQVHLWVERHAYGNNPYEASWHLSRSI